MTDIHLVLHSNSLTVTILLVLGEWIYMHENVTYSRSHWSPIRTRYTAQEYKKLCLHRQWAIFHSCTEGVTCMVINKVTHYSNKAPESRLKIEKIDIDLSFCRKVGCRNNWKSSWQLTMHVNALLALESPNPPTYRQLNWISCHVHKMQILNGLCA